MPYFFPLSTLSCTQRSLGTKCVPGGGAIVLHGLSVFMWFVKNSRVRVGLERSFIISFWRAVSCRSELSQLLHFLLQWLIITLIQKCSGSFWNCPVSIRRKLLFASCQLNLQMQPLFDLCKTQKVKFPEAAEATLCFPDCCIDSSKMHQDPSSHITPLCFGWRSILQKNNLSSSENDCLVLISARFHFHWPGFSVFLDPFLL